MKFISTEKHYNRQYAACYAVYMMAGSYFAAGKGTAAFRKMYLHYAEMPRQKQYQSEEKVIRAMNRLDTDFLKKISDLRCEISCKCIGDDMHMKFRTGGFEGLSCVICPDGTFQIAPVESL